MRALALALVVSACGRIDFDPLGGGDGGIHGDGTTGDGAMSAGPQGTGSSFMETVVPGGSLVVTGLGNEQPGDLLMLAVYLDGPTAQITTPSSWLQTYSRLDSNRFLVAFFERRFAAGDPTSYSFPISGATLAAWALIGYRGYVMNGTSDMQTMLSGTASAGSVTYTTPAIDTRGEVVMLMIDDAGSSGGTGASTWTAPTGLTNVANAYRVAIFHGDVGVGTRTFTTSVDVAGATGPRGAVWLRAF